MVAGLAAVVLLGTAAAVFAVDRLIPVDAIRERAIAEVKARTGRTLTIGEQASVSLWPRLAVVLNDVTLSEPKPMSTSAFARAASVEAQAEIWPLLTGKVKLERLVLRDPVILFRIDRNGRRSWDFAADTASAPVRYAQVGRVTDVTPRPKELEEFAKGATPPSAPESTSSTADDRAALKSLQIINGTLRHLDERTGKSDTLTGLTATLTADNLAAPVSVEGHATWRGKVVNASAVAQPFRAVIDQKPFAVRSTFKAPGADISFAGNVALAAGPDIDGNLTVKAGSIQDISAWAGLPLGGGIANGPLDFKANTRTNAAGVTLSEMTLAVDGMTVRGNAALAMAGMPRPRLTANLQASAVHVDQVTAVRALDGRASAPQPSAVAAPALPASIDDLLKAKPATPARPQVRGFMGRNGWSDEPIDLTSLGLFDADVKLAFAALTAGKLKAGNGQTAITLTNKVGRVDIADLQIYDGRARGTITADATNASLPVVGANLLIDGVSSLDFLRDAGGVDIVAGKARISTSLSGHGQSERQIVESLTGKAEIAMANGALVGISIPKILQALSQGRQPSFERVPSDRTEFSELSGSVNIVNGVAQNQDLKFTTPQVRVTGTGTVNLPARTIDYVARPKLAGPQSIQVGQMTLNVGNIEVPVRVAGTFDKIAVAPELQGIVKNPNQAVEAIKKLDRKEAESTVKGVLDGDPAAKAKAREFLKNLIK